MSTLTCIRESNNSGRVASQVVSLLALAVTVLTGSEGLAADLKAPFELESAKVLPKGVRNPRFKNLFMSVDGKFNGVGSEEPLGQKLNKNVSWGDILESQESDLQRTLVKGVLKDLGMELAGSPGETSGEVNTFANVKVPVLAMGVTDRLTLAVAVPIMSVDVSADTGFKVSEDGKTFIASLCETNPDKCNESAGKLNDAVNQKLKRLGYEQIPSHQTVKGIGDVKFVAKYLAYQDEKNSLAVKGDVTFPTGRKPNADKALDIPLGDGQYDVGAAVVYDRGLVTDLRLNTYAGYTVQVSDHIEKRLPTSVTDSLSKDKELLKRNLGDVASMGSSLNYDFPSVGVSLGAGYSFQYLTKTRYGRGQFEENRYRLLEAESPHQAIHSATLMSTFSTVEWYKQKKFVYPFQANVAYSRPIAGRNVTTNDVIAAELVLFF